MKIRKLIMTAIAGVMALSMMAGCTENAVKEPVDTFQPQTKTVTFVDGKETKSLTIGTTGFGISHDGYVMTDLTMTNRMGVKVAIGDEPVVEEKEGTAADAVIYVSVDAYFDGSYQPVEASATGSDNMLMKKLNFYKENGVTTSEYTMNGSLYFKAPSDNWKVMNLVFTVTYGDNVQEIQFQYTNV